MKITFIGLGVMGYPMAAHLAKNGYQVTVFNRSAPKAQKWMSEFASVVERAPIYQPNVKQACENADMVISCISKDEDVLELTLGSHGLTYYQGLTHDLSQKNDINASNATLNHEAPNNKPIDDDAIDNGVFSVMKPGAIFIDHSTISAEASQHIANIAKQQQLSFLDAPVSGGQAGAENGALTIMVGGEFSAFVKAEPVMKSYAKAVTYMGESGNGQRTKMVNQICIAGLVQALSEAIAFSEKCQLDTKRVLSVISKGAAQSWQMENRGCTMIDDAFDFGFAVEHMRKDLAICFNEATKNGADLTVTQLIDDYYREIEEMGGKRWDTSSLIKRLK